MSPTLMVLIAAAIAVLAFAARAFHWFDPVAQPVPNARPRTAAPPSFPIRKPQAPPTAVSAAPPELVLLEWEPAAAADPTGEPSEPADANRAVDTIEPSNDEALRAKLRDRYITARFPGVARSAADLLDTDRVIKGVRLYFEEQKLDRADELLELAIRQPGSAKLLRLARLELAFLGRDAVRFTEFARDFHAAFPDSTEWVEVTRLGRAVAPAETTLFGIAQDARPQDSYGPWPDMPNWLNASWDLTPEILSADFHREMARGRPPAPPASQRDAA